MLENWLAARKHKKKINDLQKAIDKLHKSFEMSTKHEKYYLEEAAKNLEDARALEYYCQNEEVYGGKNYKSSMTKSVLLSVHSYP
ncbi:unnamed protein product [Arabidopsis halleri]